MKKSIISLLIIASLLCSTVYNICFANNTEKKELLVGFSTPFAPFQENVNDELVGYDVDVMNYICSQLNLEPKYIDVPDFMDLLPMLFSGEMDCVTALGTSEDRMTKFDFTRPYYVGTFIDPEDPTNDELVRWSIAFPKGSSYTNQFNDIILKAEKNGTLQKMASKYNLSHAGTDAVINGDFSAVAGTYKNSYNEEIKLYENGLDEWRLNNEYFEYKIEHIWEDGGSYQWIIVPYDPYDKDVALEGYRMIVYPENVEVKTVGGEIVQSDTSKIRLWCGNGDVYDNQYIYYKQDEALSDETKALLNGDFSEFSGIYKYNSGNSFELLANGLSNLDISDEETEFRVEDITKCSDGTYMWSVNCYYYGECMDGIMCILYPKGVEVVSYDGKILPTDTSKVRFWSGNAEVSDVQYIAYKQDEAADEIKVVLNGEEIEFDQPPVMINDRVMVPIRAIFEAMGYTVEWNGSSQTAFAKRFNNSIYIQINQPIISYFVKSETGEYYCDVVPQIKSERTLVPVRAIAESAGCLVEWDDSTKTVYIDSLMDMELHSFIVNAQGDMTDNDAYIFKTIMEKNKLGADAKKTYIHSLKEPNQEYFEKMVNAIASEADENDITYFFFSGHGGVSDDKSETVICLDYNYEEGGTFDCKMSELINYLNNIPGKIVLILNSCQSGYINERLNDVNKDKDKFKIITSCRTNEYSSTKNILLLRKFIGDEVIHGKFTEVLIEALGGYNDKIKADYNNDNKVTFKELYQYIDENMDKTYVYDGDIYSQNPTCSNPNDDTVIYEY